MPVVLQATSATSGDAAWVDASPGGLLLYQSAIPISPGNTVLDRYFPPSAMTVTGIWVYAADALVSAGGTYTLTIVNVDNGSASLISATVDLEEFTGDTFGLVDLSAVPGAVDLEAHDQILASFVSNNADLTGGGLYWGIYGTPA